jgi:hypothetical protein
LQHQKKWNNHPGHFQFFYLIFKLFVSAQKAKQLSHWSRYQFLSPNVSRFDFNPWQGEKIRERKTIFLKDANIKNMFSSSTCKSYQPKDVVFAFRISNCNRSDFWTPTVHSSSNTVLRH